MGGYSKEKMSGGRRKKKEEENREGQGGKQYKGFCRHQIRRRLNTRGSIEGGERGREDGDKKR